MLLVFVFAGLVLIVLLVAAALPSRYTVEKTAVISKPVSEVMNKIGDLQYYARWNPWQQMDPASAKSITGAPMHTGHSYAWHGKKVGEGSLTIKNIDARHIYFDLQFLKPWKSHAMDNWLFEEEGEAATRVTWQNSGTLPWPMARLMGPVINKNLNHQFQKGLTNLKKMVEES
jgi:Polyketide cyclase / dehydrase and lipid transport